MLWLDAHRARVGRRGRHDEPLPVIDDDARSSPPLEGKILPGVTRDTVLTIAREGCPSRNAACRSPRCATRTQGHAAGSLRRRHRRGGVGGGDAGQRGRRPRDQRRPAGTRGAEAVRRDHAAAVRRRSGSLEAGAWSSDAAAALSGGCVRIRSVRGNPAAVCPLETWVPDATMQAELAAENNLAETAFFVPTGPAQYHLRWFTPEVEVDLCGHATLASAARVVREAGPDGVGRGVRHAEVAP